MSLRVFNSLTKKKEKFTEINAGKVNMYVCGVTVYDLCHIGHARANVVFDVIYRYLVSSGYDVKYVRNFTDIDDKIIKKANEENVRFDEITTRYIDEFNADMHKLNLKKPAIEPKATEHIADMTKTISTLIEKGYAYAVDGDVYFSVESFSGYGKLSSRSTDEMLAGARVEIDKKKRNPLDFALWKASKPDEPKWWSPWGEGRPGWHIECSTMSTKYLGDTFDIHGGGKDLIFPHHENEIAQAEGATGVKFVNYWLHNGFVNINAEKMSKSLKNFFTIKDVLKEYHPEVLRLFLITNHYRSPVDFTEDNMKEAKGTLDRCYALLKLINEKLILQDANNSPQEFNSALELKSKLSGFKDSIKEAMDDDFNTAVSLSVLLELVRLTNRYIADAGFTVCPSSKAMLNSVKENISYFKEIFGILTYEPATYFSEEKVSALENLDITEAEILKLIDERMNARKEKNFALADEIRDRLISLGIILEDTKDGTIWKVR